MRILLFVSTFCFLLACESGGGVREDATLEELDRWRAIADSAYVKKQYERALNHYLLITESIPQDAEVWFRLGNTYNRLGDNQKAIDAYKETLLRDNTFSKAWYNRSMVQLKVSVETFQDAVNHLHYDDPVYKASIKASEELLEIIRSSNNIIADSYKVTNKNVLSPDEVEVIINKEKTRPAPVNLQIDSNLLK